MEGVTFGLFDAEATEFTEETAIEVTTTNESGEFSFEAPYGSFQVMELATLPGYLTMEEPVAVEVNAAEVEMEPIANNQTDQSTSPRWMPKLEKNCPGLPWNCTAQTAP